MTSLINFNLWKEANKVVSNGFASILGHKLWTVDELLPPACVRAYGNFFPSGFNPLAQDVRQHLLFFSELSMLAYSESKEDCEKFLSPLGLSRQRLLYNLDNRTTDPDVLAFDKGEDVFLAFRGTEPFSLVDWKTDSDVAMGPFDPTVGNKADVHQGFWNSARVVLNDSGIKDLLKDKKRIWICGHRY